MILDSYRTLGRSGLKVSPLALGTMTFGTDWGWGADEATARALFDRYLDAGGNFIDTADLYVGGRSEEMLGRFIAQRGVRDQVVLATKFSYNAQPGNPNAGGNGRKNIHRAVEGSLRRLGTDYLDLLWLHTWDLHTPVEEVVRSLDALVRAGTVRYVGLSDVPAWYLARYNTIAELQGFERAIALQPEYSLVERTIEREHLPAARELGVGVTPWSPLASGFLTGKYVRGAAGSGRLETVRDSGNPAFAKFTDRNWAILDVLREVAAELERPMAQVALAWVVQRPGITSTLIGATRVAQLDDNLRALEVRFTDAQRARLDAVSALEAAHPYAFFEPFLQGLVNGNVPVEGFTR
jgi:aryl-alcohol dehydrogenase-like predicted oxidoreductase